MLNEQKLIEKIGETKIDKIELSNAIIHEIKDMYELMDKEILVDNSTLNKYVTTNGQMFSYLHLKSDKEIHSLKASCTGYGKQYKQITFYDKKNQIEIKFEGNYMRFEIKLKGAENIRNAFGTNKFYELTQEKVEEYFRNQVKKLIEKPLDRWNYNRDKYLMALMKNQYRDNLNAWQVNTLRVLMNKEIEQGKPCLLDIEELYPLIDRMEVNKKGRIKRNLLQQAQKYEKIFCNNDTFKLQEIMDKLLI